MPGLHNRTYPDLSWLVLTSSYLSWPVLSWPVLTCPDLSWPALTCLDLSWPTLRFLALVTVVVPRWRRLMTRFFTYMSWSALTCPDLPSALLCSSLPAILVFWGHFRGSWEKLSYFLNLRWYLLLYSKRPPWSHSFNAKIGLKNGPPWAEIIEKKQNGVAVWFGMPCLKTFLQVSWPTVVCFSNQFLHWDRGIEAVVLSTIRGMNRVFKNRIFFPTSLENGLKTSRFEVSESQTNIGSKKFGVKKILVRKKF